MLISFVFVTLYWSFNFICHNINHVWYYPFQQTIADSSDWHLGRYFVYAGLLLFSVIFYLLPVLLSRRCYTQTAMGSGYINPNVVSADQDHTNDLLASEDSKFMDPAQMGFSHSHGGYINDSFVGISPQSPHLPQSLRAFLRGGDERD
eukprot:TRINITY_DN1910_c0_g1_i1.p2 TRINITY_DN1910_c0_g1~~TRINITY_DN1910_c0_g1_i1.p2  ORF type:complete len:148 (+),score=25.51 TRINITY_DN1910_c0_g1_i1:584-1027(+)